MRFLMKASIVKYLSVPFLALGLVISVSACFSVAQAQESAGINIKPAIVEDRVDPGQTYNFTLRVTNLSEVDRTYYLSAQDITGLDDRGLPIFAEEGMATEFELSNWIRLPSDSIFIRAGQMAEVPYSITVPQDASPGAHFGGVFFDAQAQRPGQTGSGVGTKVGTIINLRISGDIVEDMQLREFSTNQSIYNEPQVLFTTRAENLGNVLVRPHGVIEITDMFGAKVGEVRVNDSAAPIFPGAERSYETEWSSDRFAFGRYQALLSIVYGEDGRKTEIRTTSFWVLPLQPLLITLGTALGIVLLMYLLIRRYIHKKLRDMGVSPEKASAEMYARKYNRPISRLTFILFTVVVFIIVFLGILFFLFA